MGRTWTSEFGVLAVVFGVLLLVSAQPAAAGNVALISSNETASELQAGSLTNMDVERSGAPGYVGHDQYRANATARWAFDMGSGATAFDHVGSNDGSISGATWTSEGLSLDGSDDTVSVSGLSQSFSGITISARFKTSSTGSNAIIERGGYNSGEFGLFVSSGEIDFQLKEVGDFPNAGSGYDDGQWHHVVAAYSSATGEVWIIVDGAVIAHYTGYTGTILSDSDTTHIGSRTGSQYHFAGTLDDVRVYEGALSPGLGVRLSGASNAKLTGTAAERWALDVGNGTTAYGDAGHDGSISGASWTPGKAGQGLAFNSSNSERVSASDGAYADASSALTVSTWVKTPADQGSSIYGGLVGKDDSSAWGLNIRNDDPYFRVNTTAGVEESNEPWNGESVDLADGQWHHVVGRYNGSAISLWVDGTQVYSTPHTGSITTNANSVMLGYRQSNDDYYNGSLDDPRLYTDRALTDTEIQYLANHPGAQLNETSQYTASHNVTNSVQGYANLDLVNASATITMQTGTGTVLNSTTVSSSGNYTLTWAESSADNVEVVVDVAAAGPNPTARVHGDGVSAASKTPAVDDSSLAPNSTATTVETAGVTLEANITDADFGTVQGDTVTAEWYVDGTLVDTTTHTSGGTISTTVDPVAGEHTWHVELSDSYGNGPSSSATAEFAVPSKLHVYNESAPTQLVDNATVEIRMYSNETGSVRVFERTTTNGTINMTGLPADQGFVVVAEADDYYNRRIYVPSLYETQSIYLLNSTVKVSDTIFAIDDYTGDYPSEHTVLLVQRALNGSYETVLGDYFGGTDEFPAQLAHGERHRLVLYNTQTGERRVAGTFTPLSSSTQTVVVTPQGVSRVDGLPPTVSMLPQFQRLPALDGAEVSVAVRDGESMVVESWNVTARLVNDTQNTVVWSYSQSGAGSQAKTLNLAGHHNATLRLSVTWNTTGGLSATKTYDISLTKTYGGSGGLLGALSSLAGLSPEGNARAAFTAFLAMLVTVFIVGATASILPSQTIPPLVGVLTLTGFSVISWVSYDVVFVAAVGFLAFTAIRRGI